MAILEKTNTRKGSVKGFVFTGFHIAKDTMCAIELKCISEKTPVTVMYRDILNYYLANNPIKMEEVIDKIAKNCQEYWDANKTRGSQAEFKRFLAELKREFKSKDNINDLYMRQVINKLHQ